MKKEIMLGNKAIARGAYEAGVRVSTAYPGTPSTEITEEISKYNNEDVYVEWSPNEKVALEVAVGASYAGARSLCCMKHVGLNVAADPLFTFSYTGVNGGTVIVVADDPGLHSSQNEQDSRYYAMSSHIPMLEPSDSQEAKDFTILAYELSEKYDTPVLMRLTTRISHSQSIVTLKDRVDVPLREYKKDITKYAMMPASAKIRHVVVEERMNKLQKDANKLKINKIEYNKKDIGVICAGATYQYVKEALPNASVLKLGMVHPLPINLIKRFAKEVKKLYIIEELSPFFETQIKALGIKCKGRELFSVQGEISTNDIREKILKKKIVIENKKELPGRPPVMCAGCPHRGVFYVLNKLKVRVSADIGCYTLGAQPPLAAVDSVLCMGASIGIAHGIEKATDREMAKKTVAVIGDSTFVHSGITGLVDAVYNKGNMTLIILDNSTTGMTGHQDNPATGVTIRGEQTHALDLEKLSYACGVKTVRKVDAYDIVEVEKVLKEELDKDGVSVIIAKRPCALLTRKLSEKVVSVDPEKCRKCNACMRIGCPAIQKAPEGYIVIDKASCNGCGVCLNMCKFSAMKKEKR